MNKLIEIAKRLINVLRNDDEIDIFEVRCELEKAIDEIEQDQCSVFYKGVTYHNLHHASTKLGIDKEELRAEILDLKKLDSYFNVLGIDTGVSINAVLDGVNHGTTDIPSPPDYSPDAVEERRVEAVGSKKMSIIEVIEAIEKHREEDMLLMERLSSVKGTYERFVKQNKTVVINSAVGSLFLDSPTEEEIHRAVYVTFTDTVFPVEGEREVMKVLVHVPNYLDGTLIEFFADNGFTDGFIDLTLFTVCPDLPGVIASALNNYFGLVDVRTVDYHY